jgi:putative Holliday junction resolvase
MSILRLMKLLGLDFGTKRIGVAISDGPGWAARGVCTIQRKGTKTDLVTIERLIEQHQVEALVMGLPFNMDGSEGRMARLVRDFAAKLERASGLTIHLFDERLSSFEAEQVLKRAQVRGPKKKRVLDQVAAGLILEGYLAANPDGGEE